MNKDNVSRFETAVSFTGPRIKRLLADLPENIKSQTQEVRLRCSRPLILSGLFGNAFVFDGGRIGFVYSKSAYTVTVDDMEECFHCVCGYSVHTHQSSICKGFVTVKGGHRVGITGTAVCAGGEITAVREISSINIRISKEYKGIATGLFSAVKNLSNKSTIIAGAPSSGKSTVLRDLARLMSGEEGGYFKTVIIDEREEIAACSNGVPGNDVGISCDVLSAYPKKEAVLIALRSMGPDNIFIDEIGSFEEVRAIEEGLNSGVDFFLTVHASSKEDLLRRPQIKYLLDTKAFGAVALLSGRDKPSVIKEIISAGELIS